MQTTPVEEIINILPKGIITIPKKFRRTLGFEEPGLARIIQDKGRLILEPVRTLPYPVRTYTNEEVNEFLAFDKQESKKLRKKKLLS